MLRRTEKRKILTKLGFKGDVYLTYEGIEGTFTVK